MAFVYDLSVGALVELPAPPAGFFIGAIGINDAGDVVGTAYDVTLVQKGFLLSGGAYRFLPIGIGDSHYTLIVHGQTFALVGGESFEFASHGFSKGVAKFRVADIEASAGLHPKDAQAFPTGLRFTRAGKFTGTMTPLCASKPATDNGNTPPGRGLAPCSP